MTAAAAGTVKAPLLPPPSISRPPPSSTIPHFPTPDKISHEGRGGGMAADRKLFFAKSTLRRLSLRGLIKGGGGEGEGGTHFPVDVCRRRQPERTLLSSDAAFDPFLSGESFSSHPTRGSREDSTSPLVLSPPPSPLIPPLVLSRSEKRNRALSTPDSGSLPPKEKFGSRGEERLPHPVVKMHRNKFGFLLNSAPPWCTLQGSQKPSSFWNFGVHSSAFRRGRKRQES